jgi:hypothetical protein
LLLIGAGLVLGLWVVLTLRPYVPTMRRRLQEGVL